MKRLLYSASMILAVFITILATHKAIAATPTPAVTITPFLQQVSIKETDVTKTFYINITNNANKPQTFRFSVIDFGSLDNTGGVVYSGSDASSLVTKYGLVSWLILKKQTTTLAPGMTEKIEAVITNEDSMRPGGHYAAIVASLETTENSVNKITINQRLSSLIFATKVGGEKYDLKLDKIYPETKRLSLPQRINLHFYNPGNVHVIPRGTVQIVDANGKVIEQGVINEASSIILPETKRILDVKLHTLSRPNLLPSSYRIVVSYRYDGFDQNAVKNIVLHYTNLYALLFFVLLSLALCGSVYLSIRHKVVITKIVRKLLQRF